MKQLETEIGVVLKELISLVISCNNDDINIVPFENSWTVGQLASHVIKSGNMFIQLINGQVRETDRKPDEIVNKLKKDLLNFSVKMDSPDFLVPEKVEYKNQEILSSLKKVSDEMKKSIKELDLSKTCTLFEIPGVEPLTRLEAVHFFLYHTQRHLNQLKNICYVLDEKSR